LTQQLENIERKVQLLAERLTALRQENTTLTQENNKLSAEQEAQQERIGELTQRLSNTQRALAQQRGDETESSQRLRKQIDQYINDIDQCIAWLQNA
jgi:predicted nuclease with TOPRIM domain